MGEIKLVAVDKVQKIEYLTTGIEEYRMFYNEMARKNNIVYDMYINIEERISYFEQLPLNNKHLDNIIQDLNKIKDELIGMHIEIYNAMEKLENLEE